MERGRVTQFEWQKRRTEDMDAEKMGGGRNLRE